MRTLIYALALMGGLLLTSCGSSREVLYMQDLTQVDQDCMTVIDLAQRAPALRIAPDDRISIVVSSKDPELATQFNLPVVTNRVGMESGFGSSNPSVSTYVVAPDGTIDFPVLGRIKVAGKDRHGIATDIKQRIIAGGLLKDPVVTVEMTNLYVSILGEVQRPGRYALDRDRMTILDAFSLAGDLTIYGRRDRILLLRQEGDQQVAYRLDLRSASNLMASPAYYLKAGDVIYVDPNNYRARQSTVNGNNVLSTSFWISLASLATSVALLIIRR